MAPLPRPDAPSLAAPGPGQPDPLAAEPAGTRRYLLPGFAILVACLLTGEFLKRMLGLILPGNILGLFILLALLLIGAVPLNWVESAARLLLWLLPFLFLPIFILAMRDHAFWAVQGRALCGAVVIGTILLWAFVGHLSQWLLRPPPGRDGSPRRSLFVRKTLLGFDRRPTQPSPQKTP